MQAPTFEHTHFSIEVYQQQTVIKFNPAYSWLYPLFKDYITSIDMGNEVLPLIPECFDDERIIRLGKHSDISHFFTIGFFLSKTLLKDKDTGWSQFCKFYEKNEGIVYDYVFVMPKENWNHFNVIDPHAVYSLIPDMPLFLLVPKALLPKLEGWQEIAPANPFEPPQAAYPGELNPFIHSPQVVSTIVDPPPVVQPNSFFQKAPSPKPNPLDLPYLKVIDEAQKIGMSYATFMIEAKKDPNNSGTLRAIAVNKILASESVSLGCKITVLWALLNKKTDGLIQNLSKGTEFVKRLRENSIIAGLNHSRGIQELAEKYCQSRAQNYPGMTALTIQEKILEKLKLGPEAIGPDDQVVRDVNIMPPAIAFAMTKTDEYRGNNKLIERYFGVTTNYLKAKQHDFFEHRGLNRAHALSYLLNLPEGDEGNMSVACKLVIIHGLINLETSGGLRNSLHSFTNRSEWNQLQDTADYYAKKLGLDANGLKALQQFILNKMLNTKIGDYSTWTEASLTAGFVKSTNIITHNEVDDWKVMSTVPN